MLSMERGGGSHSTHFDQAQHGDDSGQDKPNTEHHHDQQIANVVQGLFRRDFASWEADDYVLNGTVRDADEYNTILGRGPRAI